MLGVTAEAVQAHVKTGKPNSMGLALDGRAPGLRATNDDIPRLQILRREHHRTKLEWLDTTDAVADGHEAPDKRPSPFVSHNGPAVDTGESYSIVSYSPNGRLLARELASKNDPQ